MRSFVRGVYSLFLIVAGVAHFFKEASFRKIVPPVLPFRKAIVLISGVIEVLFGVLLWVKKAQQLTGKLIALFMVLIFPANIYMAVKKVPVQGKQVPPLLLWARLPLQIPLVLGALWLRKSDKEKNS
ncbi:DoxX family protein [Aureibacillus halotolerans]|uniref:Putative membrane protein n=1 Tax=Aureibacillus halotolerans TaxID=1508390 RepID=A0A4R6U6P2_9BACI|nr:hypothetical protein [Aureibacillus halotolerans]TDQ38694.1 putative membrane protein [Aureibacillus halotolerans]